MMLFLCFTVFKSLHELTGDLQRKSAESSWGFTHFRVPTDRNDFYLNPECHPKCGCPDRKPTASRNIELASGVLPAADWRHSMAASEFASWQEDVKVDTTSGTRYDQGMKR